MQSQLGLALTSAFTVIGAAASVYFWRKSASLYALLVEGANRFEDLRNRTQTLEQALAKSEEKAKTFRETMTRLDKAAFEAREKAAELLKQLATKEAEAQAVSDKLELQKSFLEGQLAKTQEKLRVSDEARQVLASDKEKAEADLRHEKDARQKAVLAAERGGELRERELVLKLENAERALESLKKKFAAVDPVEVKKVKRKIAQYDRLYMSMRGMREMALERNKNWEVALSKFARWIIREASGPDASIPSQIGPLVGRALGLIGESLVEDNTFDTERPGAIRAADFNSLDDAERARERSKLAAELEAADAALAKEGDNQGEEARLAAATLRRGEAP